KLEINLVKNAVRVFETVVIAGRTIHPLKVLLPTEVTTLGVSDVLIEQQSSNVPSHLLFPRTLSKVTRGGHAVIQVTNTSPTDITLYRNTTLGHCTPVQNLLAISTENCDTQTTPTPSSPAIDLSHSNLSQSQKQQLQELLDRYNNVFVHPGEPLGRTNMVKHPIKTSGAPIRQSRHRLPASLKDTVNSQIQDMLDTGVIQPSCSPWASPVVMVKKKDGTWRFCVDYRKVNAITHHDAYPLPRIDATLDSLAGSTLFTTLDLASGYWQVELESSDKEKTAFSTSKGHFEFNVMPFGLTNAPATFQRLMECVLAGISGELCLAYLDDIIVFSATFEEHLHRLATVLQRLQAANLKLKPAKCHFAQSKVEYLGHIISGNGIQVDPKKTTAISDYPVPANVKQLKQFLGLANYYRKFIQNYASVAEPLHKLLRKNSGGYGWNEQCQQSFNLLKQKLVN
ncbi:MAG: reverse transcriptase family protein, partial [Acidobacteria bacterium]|nr:reverse transcriptase family protein [Acidobacteriota bacterium]